MDVAQLRIADFSACLRPREPDSHKGSHGTVVIVGGVTGMEGALLLASRSALLIGCGKVFGLLLDYPKKLKTDERYPAITVDNQYPELMFRSTVDLLSQPFVHQITAAAIGPGLGTSEAAKNILADLLVANLPLVIDADGLNLLALHQNLQELLSARLSPTLLTPHPAEAARLLGCTISEIQGNRENACLSLVRKTGAYVVLKGRGSLLGSPEDCLRGIELLYQNPTGNPGMASAGMGDVLTGMVLAFLAQKNPPMQALCAAVYLHGLAADDLVSQGIGPIGLTATEVSHSARAALNRLVNVFNATAAS
jgi:hydroxyethylthiazole kinase-like uncharacterized protein yjeF